MSQSDFHQNRPIAGWLPTTSDTCPTCGYDRPVFRDGVSQGFVPPANDAEYDAMRDDNALWFGISALSGYGDDTLSVWERLEDVFGTERAGMVVAALCELGEDEIKEGSR